MGGDDRHKTAKRIRADRKKFDNWVHRNGRDFCETCAKHGTIHRSVAS